MVEQNDVLKQNIISKETLTNFTAERIRDALIKREEEIRMGLVKDTEPEQVSVSTREKGMYGEKLAEKFFKQCGWQVKMAKNIGSAYDMLVSNGPETFAVNVKFGRYYSIRVNNVLNLFKTGIIPAFLFITMDKKYIFFVPKIIEQVKLDAEKKV